MTTFDSCRTRRRVASLGALFLVLCSSHAGGAELPTARPADVGMSAERLAPVLLDPPAAGNLGSKGTFGWAGAASTWAILDPEEDLVLILMSQYMVNDAEFAARFQTLAYQAIVD